MTKAIWIIGAVIVVGVGIAAGIIFAGGDEPQALAPTASSATSAGVAANTPTGIAAQPVSAPVPVQAVAQVESNVAADVGPIVIETLDELFANAASYTNKDVVVRGTIVTQCISGCTFSLEDGTAVIAVELIDDALDNVLGRGSVGRSVEVRGIVETSPQLVIVIEEPEDWNYID